MNHRSVRVAVMLTVALSVGAVGAAGAVPPSDAGRAFVLELGDRVFWSGPGDHPADCGTDCWTYSLTVAEPGYRLRVGIDRPRLGDVWRLEVRRPSGSLVGSASPGTELYSAELLDRPPAVGTYEVRVSAREVVDRRFRVRATLEKDNGGLPNGHVLVPPNLRALPPWDFSFLLPLTNGGFGGDSKGVAVPGGRTACHAEEVVLYTAVRCIRMAFGVANVGLGPLQLSLGPGNPFADRPLRQHVRYADTGSVVRDAGNAYYHHSHAHYHHDRAVGLELFRVTDAAKGLFEPAGTPLRKGFAHRNELLREWTGFYPTTTVPSGTFGLLPGWGDYYEWDRPGNYIDFGLNADGLYFVRITADPDGFLQETTRSDNVAYSLIRVKGDTITHLESGRGSDPWDRCRVPMPLGTEFEDSFTLADPRPEDCPA